MISRLLLRVSVVLALVGMMLGFAMGMREDFTLVAAHAHLNLVGFVAMFLAGLYYQITPKAASSVLARYHAWIAIAGAVVFPAGIAVERLGGSKLWVVLGATIVLIGAVLFLAVVFRTTSMEEGTQP